MRMYYYNVFQNSELIGSVRAESSTEANNIAISLGVSSESCYVKRVTSKETVEPLEEAMNKKSNFTSSEEEASTEDTVGHQEDSDEELPKATEKQVQAYANLKAQVAKWDEGKREDVKTKYKMNKNGLMFVRTSLVTKKGALRKRELIIGKNGGIRAYGKKPKGSRKLMIALKDVIKFCFVEEEL